MENSIFNLLKMKLEKSSSILKRFSSIAGLLLIIFFAITFIVSCDENDILDRLSALEGVNVMEIQPYYGYERAFQIDFIQPVDHNNPNGPTFTQRIYLSHAGDNAPMVFAPSGYGTSERSGQELAGIISSNTLNVTHRYFPNSRPASLEWQYCTIWQAAADHHRIVETFKTIYTGVWVSAGASKSGLTPLFHKRYYPNDVTAVVAYVSPFMFSTSDLRYTPYLKSIGTAGDWERIIGFQRLLLQNRSTLISMILDWLDDNNYTFTSDADTEYESLVCEYDWSYWQYKPYEPSEIPVSGATDQEMFDALDEVVRVRYLSDEMMDYFDAYLYQAFSELGYPARDFSHLDDLRLTQYPTAPEYFLAKYGVTITYNPSTILDIYNWLQTEGNNIIYIYGGDDPWTAGEIELTGVTNAYKVTHPGGSHRVRIADLAVSQRDHVISLLEQWLGININYDAQRQINVPRNTDIEGFPVFTGIHE